MEDDELRTFLSLGCLWKVARTHRHIVPGMGGRLGSEDGVLKVWKEHGQLLPEPMKHSDIEIHKERRLVCAASCRGAAWKITRTLKYGRPSLIQVGVWRLPSGWHHVHALRGVGGR